MHSHSLWISTSPSRSIFERAKEHRKDAEDEAEDSNMLKHWTNHHEDGDRPGFIMEVVRFCRDSLSRQVGEAVRIDMRGSVLNSQAIFNRSRLPRLVVDQDYLKEIEMDKLEKEAGDREANKLEAEGVKSMGEGWRKGAKREMGGATHDGKPRKRAKLKHPVAAVNWGLQPQVSGSWTGRHS
jgi:hypothetical protein